MKQSRPKSQREQVLDRLTRRGKITPRQAWEQMDITRLAPIILRLRRQGHSIRTEVVIYRTAAGELKEYATYHLQGRKKLK